MIKIFEYVAYRIFRYNRIRFNARNDINSSVFYSIIQFVFLLDILGVVVTENYTSTGRFAILEKYNDIILTVGIILFFFNLKYFKNKYAFLEDRWRNEEIKKRTSRGWIIAIGLTIIGTFWLFYTILRGNPNG